MQNKELRSKLAEVTAGSDYFNYKSFDVDKVLNKLLSGLNKFIEHADYNGTCKLDTKKSVFKFTGFFDTI